MSRRIIVHSHFDSDDLSFERLVAEHPECGKPLTKKRNPATGEYSLSCSVCGVDVSFDDTVLVAFKRVAISQEHHTVSVTTGATEEVVQLLPENE